MAKLRIGISGAAGRMGKRLVALTLADPQIELAAALESLGNPALGHDAGLLAGERASNVAISDRLSTKVDVLIDFSVPSGAERATQLCRERVIPLVMATTGLSRSQRDQILTASREVAVVMAPSMSMAVNLTMKLAGLTAMTLASIDADADIEIIERHHRFKEDAPSGTALKFGEIIASEMGITNHRHGRQGRPGERPRDEIGYHAVRTGDNPGEHTMVFGMLGETIELTVRASSRDSYAAGALMAAKFVAQQQPGLYDMFSVLGLS
jgi:4-hydroxy-tetrahydrodipicolinate reductase